MNTINLSVITPAVKYILTMIKICFLRHMTKNEFTYFYNTSFLTRNIFISDNHQDLRSRSNSCKSELKSSRQHLNELLLHSMKYRNCLTSL